MSGYVIINNDTGKYLAPSGSIKSYTPNVLNARRFKTEIDARAHCLSNERYVSVESLFKESAQ